MGNSNCFDIECNSRTFILSQLPKETIGRTDQTGKGQLVRTMNGETRLARL